MFHSGLAVKLRHRPLYTGAEPIDFLKGWSLFISPSFCQTEGLLIIMQIRPLLACLDRTILEPSADGADFWRKYRCVFASFMFDLHRNMPLRTGPNRALVGPGKIGQHLLRPPSSL